LERLARGDRTPVEYDESDDPFAEDPTPPTVKKVGQGYWLWIKEIVMVFFWVEVVMVAVAGAGFVWWTFS